MRAIVYERYGSPDVLELRDVAEPAISEDRMLIRVRAASVNRSDWETLTARPAYVRVSGSGVLKPKNPILGSDMAGTVEAVGSAVDGFQVGDEVFGDIMWHGAAAFAEYVSVPASAPIIIKPPELSFEAAAALPQASVLALQGLRRVRETWAGDRVLIIGAGGGGGSFAVQLAASAGARVTGVDNAAKLDLMKSLGADDAVDYTRDRATGRFDRILDFAGKDSIFRNRRLLGDGGIYSMVGGTVPRMLQAVSVGWVLSKAGDVDMRVLLAKPNKEDLAHLASLVVNGTITPAIERTYRLVEVPDALAHLGTNAARGKLVITV